MMMKVLLFVLASSVNLSNGFVIRPTTTTTTTTNLPGKQQFLPSKPVTLKPTRPLLRNEVSCQMAFLPPSNDDNNKSNEFGDIVKGALGILGVVAFFASPLGGIFFAIVNSFFALAILTPLVAVVAFQGWTYFNTIDGPCPNCGSPVKVLKDDSPSICLNCGTMVRSSADNSSIDYAGGGNNDIFSDASGSGDGADFFGDIFDQAVGVKRSPMSPDEEKAAERRQQTIIDVEVDKD
mmetsp:Transcript_8893/g.12619  ORF Transcript_8893/g.12619 Transcript_8893/m.12619 type:complete len:236 (-) Transcript_8893:58-765(-)